MFERILTYLLALVAALTAKPRTVVVSKPIAAAGDYAANDVLSESATADAGTAWHVSGLVDTPGRPFLLTCVRATCSEDSVLARLRLHGFRRRPNASTEMDDNAAFTVADADRSSNNQDLTNYLDVLTDMLIFADKGAFSGAVDPDLRVVVQPDPNSTGFDFIVETMTAEANETAAMVLSFEFTALPL